MSNIYNENIDNFIVGYFIDYKVKEYEIVKIYKEINPNVRKLTYSKRFTSDIIEIENLNNVRLVIYTDIQEEMNLKTPLVFGKANYLAKIKEICDIELLSKDAYGYNQYTDISIVEGMIKRVNTLTKYNEQKGYYDYKSTLVRENTEFKYNNNYDSDEEQSIFLWQFKGGEVHAY